MSDTTRILPPPGTGPTSTAAGGAAAGALALRQRAFAAALLDPAHPLPSGLIGPDGAPSAGRFAVYRNNVVAGLIEALTHAYPAVLRLVGAEFFQAMARVYVVREPPPSPILLDYGAGFAGFLRTFAPVDALPYLPDVACLERAWLDAYHAAEATSLDPTALAGIAHTDLPGLLLRPHPSVRVVTSAFPVVSIWQATISDAAPAAIDIAAGGQDALVMRPATEVEVRALPAGAAPFIQTLALGAPVLDAARAGLRAAPGFDLAGTLAALFAAGALVGWHLPNHPPTDLCRSVA